MCKRPVGQSGCKRSPRLLANLSKASMTVCFSVVCFIAGSDGQELKVSGQAFDLAHPVGFESSWETLFSEFQLLTNSFLRQDSGIYLIYLKLCNGTMRISEESKQ